MTFTLTRCGDHTTARCDRCRHEITWRGGPDEQNPAARNAQRTHLCVPTQREEAS